MNVLKCFAKLVGAIIVLGTLITLPAFGEMSTEDTVCLILTRNTSRGIEKGLSLRGRKLSEAERKDLQTMCAQTANKVVTIVKEAGLLDEYAKQLNDPDIKLLDEQAFKAKDISEVYKLMSRQLLIVSDRYPRIYAWLLSKNKAADAMQQLMVLVAVKYN